MGSFNPLYIIIAVIVIVVVAIIIAIIKKASSGNSTVGSNSPVSGGSGPSTHGSFVVPSASEFEGPSKTKEYMVNIENDIMETANDAIANAGKLRASGDYVKAESEFLLAKGMILNLTTIDAGYYEPTLYAVCDELGKMYYMDMHNTAKAVAMLREAYYYCDRCAKRAPGSAASRDLNMIRNNLNKLS